MGGYSTGHVLWPMGRVSFSFVASLHPSALLVAFYRACLSGLDIIRRVFMNGVSRLSNTPGRNYEHQSGLTTIKKNSVSSQ